MKSKNSAGRAGLSLDAVIFLAAWPMVKASMEYLRETLGIVSL
jgi:hypothetical protein